jgi:biotin operon repressor
MTIMKGIAGVAVVAIGMATATPISAANVDWSKVDNAFGRKGAMQPGDVYRVTFPRTDLQVTLDGIALKPGFASGSHLEMKAMGDKAVLMGDLVLTDSEVNPVMKRLIDGGIEITAVHNHLLRTSPALLYMHVGGSGDPVGMAGSIRAALELSKTPLTAAPATPPPALELDTGAIDNALGVTGKNNGGVYQLSIPRAEAIAEQGMAMPPAMGTAIAINFQPTGGGKAAITGDFVLLAKEVNPVLKALRDNGIDVTALHSHMLDDQPHVFFMHFWANDDALKLARGLKAALGQVNVAKG